MNFLAHLLLAGPAEADRLGALMGDFVKGPLPGTLPPDIAAGVRLHRSIDSFADVHPAFRRSRERMSKERRRYAGILVDMFYDHLLARHWLRFHPQPLSEFAQDAYAMLRRHHALLPERLAAITPAMAAHDWLTSYAEMESLTTALVRMAQRLRRENSLAGGETELTADYAGFEGDFAAFIGDVLRFCQAEREARR
jgi:acyl carrier protein phosphodiesterase